MNFFSSYKENIRKQTLQMYSLEAQTDDKQEMIYN